MTQQVVEEVTLRGVDGNLLAASAWGAQDDPLVLMLHGIGQTRHSWRQAGPNLAARGFRVLSLDARGHGDSAWSADGRYDLPRLAEDLLTVLDQLPGRATLVGASMGGLTSLLVAEAVPDRVRSLVLVDIVARAREEGSQRIRAFMSGNIGGFATLEEAADAIADYLPHRRRNPNPQGLRKNLRQGEDGRWYWHWDPAIMAMQQGEHRTDTQARALRAGATLTCPTLLVYGRSSDVVDEEAIEEFRAVAPHLEIRSLVGAGHTAASDVNDVFTETVVEFCLRTKEV
ncbi:alpha/beta fold hydrolase [Granulicoccus phenolivorans]|uniref:alpha/beta fold hydrolase n=1 Tax=Granulicoccus phenolivorans TaxID=266854 RepID=UPI0004055B77|nr:alpha/beta hydrolase [Granulicoccus phenolivorans]